MRSIVLSCLLVLGMALGSLHDLGISAYGQHVERKNWDLLARITPDTIWGKLDEAVILKVTLTNRGSKPLRVMRDLRVKREHMMHASFCCEISQNGQPYLKWQLYQMSIYPIQPRKTDFRNIRNGRSTSGKFNLLEFYQIEEPGTYQVRAIYIQGEDERFGLPKVERVYSNWVTVILEP